MKSEKFAIFLDIDNTLYVDGIIPGVNIDAINLVRENGHFVFLNTARGYACIPSYVKNAVKTDGVSAGMGVDVRIGDKQIFSDPLKTDELKSIASYFLGDRREIGFEGEDAMVWINPGERRFPCGLLHSPSEFDTVYKDVKISKMYVSGDLTPEDIERFKDGYDIFCHGAYSEFVKKGRGKAFGMKKILERINVPLKNCIAMGDSGNDEDMLKCAGISVAMGNAIDEIKSICGYVSSDAKDGGVAQAIYKYLKL